MGKNNDLDMQTFQIYQDEETDMPDLGDKEKEPPKKGGGLKGVFAKFKKNKIEQPKTQPKNIVVTKEKVKAQNSSNNEVIKGVAIGLLIMALVIVLDILNII